MKKTPIAELVPGQYADRNAEIAGFLRDMAVVHERTAKAFGYKRAAAVVLALDVSLDRLVAEHGTLPKIGGLGPASGRIIGEVLAEGHSPTVERAVSESRLREEVDRRRALRRHFLSRAGVRRVLDDPAFGPPLAYAGDFQMHSEWSDGAASVSVMAAACQARGYRVAAITDHSRGLPIAGGLTPADVGRQQAEIDEVNGHEAGRFRLLKGIEANIDAEGRLDLEAAELAAFDIVLAAPHGQLRLARDQTERLLRVVNTWGVHVLAHPRGRITGSRAGVQADWDRVFEAAAAAGVAVELDGDPSRQDLDYTLARRAREHGCLFACDSDAHGPSQLWYAEIAIAHARLAGIPSDRLINTWPIERLTAWLDSRRQPPSRPPKKRRPRVPVSKRLPRR